MRYVGTTLVVVLDAYALASANWRILLALPVARYFFAWRAYFAFEKNRPTAVTYPLWSLVVDFKMWFLWLTGRLKDSHL